MIRDQWSDLLIVGTGPVGSAFARTIGELAPEMRVTLIDAGPQITTPPGRHVKTISDPAARLAAQVAAQGPTPYPYENPSNPLADSRRSDVTALSARLGTFLARDASARGAGTDMPAAAMSSNVGGMGAHWTCAAPVPGEGERIELIPRDEFDEAFAEAWRLLSVTSHAFDGAPLGDEVRTILAAEFDHGREPDRRVQPMPLGIRTDERGDRHWTGSDLILGDLLERDTVELIPETLARRLLIEDDRVAGALVEDLASGERYEIRSRVVVVAADAFRTPQLLFSSGIRPRALGHYLNEHPQVFSVLRLDDRFVPEHARTEKEPDRVELLSGVSWIPYDRVRLPFHIQIMQLDASPIPIDGSSVWAGSIVGVNTFGTKDIQYSDQVAFSDDEVDYLGMPAMTIHYELTAIDLVNQRLAEDTLARITALLGEPLGGGSPRVLPAGSSLHYMGTVRMGAVDDGESVCDDTSKVWGFSNLYVGGNGVIPTATACNPTATSVALAVRSARAIVASLAAGTDAG